ncbi:MAG: hypothetical protein OES78_10080, partial [Chromatiales bacterium]|nr:hypothetical protein [Chromatiales bacterium]
MRTPTRVARLLTAAVLILIGPLATAQTRHSDLVELFEDWRRFESPPLLNGAPDYTAERFAARQPEYLGLRERLMVMDISEWPIEQQVDWHLVRAEMNGYD